MAETNTAAREHVVAFQSLDAETGYRWWSDSMPESAAAAEMDKIEAREGYFIDDYGCAVSCWCEGKGMQDAAAFPFTLEA